MLRLLVNAYKRGFFSSFCGTFGGSLTKLVRLAGRSCLPRLALTGILVFLPVVARAQGGDLDPPGPPGPTMKSLDAVEPRIPVFELPAILDAPGSYYLVGNLGPLEPDQNGIVISANNITLDLNGFSVFGSGPEAGSFGTGILVSGTLHNIIIRNGAVRNWRWDGINAVNAENGSLTNLRVSHNGNDGIQVGNNMRATDNACYKNAGHGLIGYVGSVLRDNTCQMNGGDGIWASYDCIVAENACTRNDGDGIQLGHDCRASGNTCNENGNEGYGAGVHTIGNRNLVEDNLCSGNDRGLLIEGAENRVTGNLCHANDDDDQFSPGNHLEILISQLPVGIHMPGVYRVVGRLHQTDLNHDAIIINANNVTLDLGGHALVGPGQGVSGTASGIYAFARSNLTIRDGSVRDWPGWGILVSGDNQSIERVNAVNNGSTGISLGGEGCRAVGNHCSGNSSKGMQVDGPAVVMENTFTNNAKAGLSVTSILKGETWSSGAVVRNNSSAHNEYGMIADKDALIEHNTVLFNRQHGIWVERGCRVINNLCSYNGLSAEKANVFVGSISNTVEHNLLNGGFYGLQVTSSGNFLASNRATHNHTDYSIAAGNLVGSGDLANVSFDEAP